MPKESVRVDGPLGMPMADAETTDNAAGIGDATTSGYHDGARITVDKAVEDMVEHVVKHTAAGAVNNAVADIVEDTIEDSGADMIEDTAEHADKDIIKSTIEDTVQPAVEVTFACCLPSWRSVV